MRTAHKQGTPKATIGEAEAWAKYLDMLAPLRGNPVAYERMEPWAWQLLQERLTKGRK